MYIITRRLNNNTIRRINNNNNNDDNNNNDIKSMNKNKLKGYIQDTIENMICAGYEQQDIESYQESVNIDMIKGNYINIIKRSLMVSKLIRDADYI